MLRIDIPSQDVTLRSIEEYQIPSPPNGTDTEINGDVVLLFEDEEEAVAYLDVLEDHAAELDNEAPEKHLINELVSTITNDEFVQAYLQ
jgi:hypothetical protein